nr:MAG TPA: hypothetical protein [Caudoviricetes sp.]
MFCIVKKREENNNYKYFSLNIIIWGLNSYFNMYWCFFNGIGCSGVNRRF